MKISGVFKEYPDIVQIQTTSRCNLACRMCARKLHNPVERDISWDIFKKIVDRIPSFVKIINLTGWGEALLNPQIFNMIKYASEKGFITYLTTNAFLLNRSMQEKLFKSGLDSLFISLESLSFGTSNSWMHPYSEKAAVNIKSLLKFRGNRKKPYIVLCVTMHPGRADNIIEIVRFAKRYNIEAVHLARLNTAHIKKLKRTSPKEDIALWRKCIKFKGKDKLFISLTEFQFLGLTGKFPVNELCPKSYNYLYINMDGQVTPCCNLPNYGIGDIFKDSLFSIWKDSKLNKFRADQKIVCKDVCNLFEYK